MLLVIDAGNTNVVLGVYEGENLKVSWRTTTRRQTSDELGTLVRELFRFEKFDMKAINGVIISCVVPPLLPILERMSHKYFDIEPVIVGPGIKTGMNIFYETPREVGADRIVNAVAAYSLYGGPVIVVDFGTATTFCAVNKKGDYLGGAISPGIGISTEALFERAAKLPRIELVKPNEVIGRNTITSMQSGIVYGYVGLVDSIVKKFKKEINEKEVFVVATGGMSKLIGANSEHIDKVNPELTLEGLRLIYERNKI